jgi:hypothetical protein
MIAFVVFVTCILTKLLHAPVATIKAMATSVAGLVAIGAFIYPILLVAVERKLFLSWRLLL